jgi:hypothetical protein
MMGCGALKCATRLARVVISLTFEERNRENIAGMARGTITIPVLRFGHPLSAPGDLLINSLQNNHLHLTMPHMLFWHMVC